MIAIIPRVDSSGQVVPPRQPALRALHVTRTYGDGENRVTALADLSIDLSVGELSLLLGPSGSGKTTLLAVLSGLLRPNTGEVRVLGEDIWSMSEKQRERFRLQHVGFIFQEYLLFPALTARQHLELVLHWGESADFHTARQRANETLAHLGLSKKGDLRPIQLSGGEKQRVAVGRALVKKPDFVFADEPTAALDWENGERVLDLLREAAHDQRAAVLVVAHDERIISYADRLYYLDDGRLRRQELEKWRAPGPAPKRTPK